MPGVKGENGSFFRVRVLYNRRTMSRKRGHGSRAIKPFTRRIENGSANRDNASIETYFVRRDLSSSCWADRSAEDRRLRKAEAVGSNPTRSTSPRPTRRSDRQRENRRRRPLKF